MSKTNYINYQKLLKDGSYYEINSYGKRKRQIKKITEFIRKLLVTLLALIFLLLLPVSVIGLVVGIVMLFLASVKVGGIIIAYSIVGLIVEPLILLAMILIDDYI